MLRLLRRKMSNPGGDSMPAMLTDPGGPGETVDPGGFQLSLVIPAWNEQETIAQALHEAVMALSGIAADYEIIVVDDGSTDSTAELVRAEAAANPRVRLVQHPRNMGYGAALRTGFQSATLDLVAFTDADCQFDLSELEYLLPLTRRYDITCGYRIDRKDPVRRRFFSWGYNTLVTLLMGSPVRDLDCALKVFRRQKLLTILPQCDNFFVNTEMLTKARLQGLSIVEVGVHHRPRAAGESKVSLLDIPKTLSALLPFWWSRVLFPNASAPHVRPGRWFWLGLLALAVAAGVQMFSGLTYPLFEPDEARYAEIAREMLHTGNWVLPTLHREPYLDKPPLLYWSLAGSFWLFGPHDWSARLVPTVSTWLAIVTTCLLTSRVFGARAALLSGVVLWLCVGFVIAGRFVMFDSVLTLWVSLSLLAAYEALRGRRLSWRWWLASAACCGLGVLTKGVIAFVLLAPPVAAFGWLSGCPGRPTRRAWLIYAGVVALISAPWFGAVMLRHPGFAYEFFWNHHISRFLNGLNHPQPLWYYVPVLLVGGLPWTPLLVPLLRFQFSRSAAVSAQRPQAAGFYLLSALWCLAFFSASSCKLPAYVLPAFPAMAVVLGVYLDGFASRWPGMASDAARQRALRYAAVVSCAVGIGVNWTGWLMSSEEVWLTVVESGTLAAALVLVAFFGKRVPHQVACAICCCVVFFGTFEVNREIVGALARDRSPLGGSRQITQLLNDRQLPVVVYGRDWSSISFYLDRDDVQRFDLTTLAELNDFLRQQPRTVIVCRANQNRDVLCRFLDPGLHVADLGRSGRADVLLVTRPDLASQPMLDVHRR